MNRTELKEWLEELCGRYHHAGFIENDPVSVPHLFRLKEDIEISGFLAATIAWGNRAVIVQNGHKLMRMMDMAPYDFVLNHTESDLRSLLPFVHRTFNGTDLVFFIRSLARIYRDHGGIGEVFQSVYTDSSDIRVCLSRFRQIFFGFPHESRTQKHISCIEKNASCKRLNMYLRWMVRKDEKEVDFGLWKKIPSSALYLPLDIHSGNTARQLGLLARKQNDWKAVEEVTAALREFDPADPVRYDYALFSAGIYKKSRCYFR